MRRHDLQHKRQTHEDSATPPAGLRQECSRLANADELIRRALSAEVRGDAPALSALQQNGGDQDDRVEYENREKQVENHLK